MLSGHTHVHGRGVPHQQVRIDGEANFFVPHAVAGVQDHPPVARHGDWQEIRKGLRRRCSPMAPPVRTQVFGERKGDLRSVVWSTQQRGHLFQPVQGDGFNYPE